MPLKYLIRTLGLLLPASSGITGFERLLTLIMCIYKFVTPVHRPQQENCLSFKLDIVAVNSPLVLKADDPN